MKLRHGAQYYLVREFSDYYQLKDESGGVVEILWTTLKDVAEAELEKRGYGRSDANGWLPVERQR